ncbi:permease [Thaumasiovibrio subtropicus]|uniref:permease n=1 Tax=Thaumasiovibrio subtropicus TaxID=1891207 RepID=UPI000B34BECF|nr:permease [Thaumasiovibrio subtropicus]
MKMSWTEMAHEALGMFAFLAVELIALFLVISYLVGLLQHYLTPQKMQAILSARQGRGYVIAALLGSVTPFCSCSTIPFLKGLLRARAGFGPMMVFLFASPLLNPVIIGLFVVTFGWQVALFYFGIAMSVAVTAGFTLEKLGFERYVKAEAYQNNSVAGGCTMSSSCSEDKNANLGHSASEVMARCGSQSATESVSVAQSELLPDVSGCCAVAPATPSFWLTIWQSTWKDFKQVLPYLMLGVFIGSMIYGFIPADFIAAHADASKWYAVPLAAVIGIPLYLRAEAVIPLSAALVQKGMALGSVMALIIGSAGASLTEVILLKSLFKTPMIIAFLVVILGMAVGAGYLYPVLF